MPAKRVIPANSIRKSRLWKYVSGSRLPRCWLKDGRNSSTRSKAIGRERTETGDLSRQLDIKTPSLAQLVVNLSGGNQQKVVLAKWLYAGAEVLIFDEPTVGVDVGAKSEIYRMMETLAAQGKVVLMISSDNPELIAVCDRVGVMRGGRLVGVLEGTQITEEHILRYSMGVDERE